MTIYYIFFLMFSLKDFYLMKVLVIQFKGKLYNRNHFFYLINTVSGHNNNNIRHKESMKQIVLRPMREVL
jgi:hypothetical protein